MKTNLILFTVIIAITIQNLNAQFTQDSLVYSFDALEPYIDAQTMEIHYTKHHAGYVKNLNKAIEEANLLNKSIDHILKNVSKYNSTIRNNGGGHYNHALFWQLLTPMKNTKPLEKLSKAIDSTFGSMQNFKKQFNQEASSRFGSGWAWLIVTPQKKLAILSTPNQDNPVMDDAPVKGIPILGIDVWEHAYYLKYQNKRNDYLDAIWNVINWEDVSTRYESAISQK
ncbi:MAG: superoxide dismutase [Fibrobacter sp.]|nr:superoxide dismutase [Fibrobacter sp.]